MKTIMYIVHYTDPERISEGPRKTRHFPTLPQARKFVQSLRDPIYDVTITEQVTTIQTKLVW